MELVIARNPDPDSSLVVGTRLDPPAAEPIAPAEGPTTAQVRSWARGRGLEVPDRGRLRTEIHQAWRDAHRAP